MHDLLRTAIMNGAAKEKAAVWFEGEGEGDAAGFSEEEIAAFEEAEFYALDNVQFDDAQFWV